MISFLKRRKNDNKQVNIVFVHMQLFLKLLFIPIYNRTNYYVCQTSKHIIKHVTIIKTESKWECHKVVEIKINIGSLYLFNRMNLSLFRNVKNMFSGENVLW